jgi:membrane protein
MISEWFAEHRQSRWLALAVKVASEFMEDRIPSVAAGVTFFVLLALFPGIGALAAIYSLFGDRATLVHELSGLSGLLPGGAMKVLAAELTRLAALKPAKIGLAFSVSFVIALWSASGGISSLIESLNIAFEVRERRSYLQVVATAIGFVLVVLIFGAILAKLIALFSPVAGLIDANSSLSWLTPVFRWLSIFLLAVVFNGLVYHYAPDRRRRRRRWLTWGSVTAAALWVLGSALFSWYVHNFGTYDRTYGALGAIVGFLTWIWLSLVVLLLGAELDSTLEDVSPQPNG